MTYAGARGETAVQMSKALRFASSNETLHWAFAELIRRLYAAGDGRYELNLANSLWGQDGAPLLAGFLSSSLATMAAKSTSSIFGVNPRTYG